LEIVLLILKIIGITLAVILGLVLLLVLIVLITPFRYQVNASYHEKIDAEVKFHFWLRAVVARVTFKDKNLLGTLRILFIKKKLLEKHFGKSDGQHLTEVPDAADNSEQLLLDAEAFAAKAEGENDTREATEENLSVPEGVIPEAEAKAGDGEAETEDTNVDEATATEAFAEEAEEAEEATFLEDETEAKEAGIAAKLESLKVKGENIGRTIAEKKEMVDKYVDFATQDHTKRAAKYVMKKVVKILKSIRPRKCKGDVTFGLRDPKTMGMICGYSGMLYPVYHKAIDVKPVFGADHTVIDGEIEIKGRIILMTIVARAVPILFKKDCRRVWKDFKKLRNH